MGYAGMAPKWTAAGAGDESTGENANLYVSQAVNMVNVSGQTSVNVNQDILAKPATKM